ncbi:hypothetical protein ABPG73_014195 [Tetrahymena malaccensis]
MRTLIPALHILVFIFNYIKTTILQTCPEIQSQYMTRFYDNYIIGNYLKIPKTNVLMINTILTDSQNYQIGSFVYYFDISSSQENIINAIKPDFTIKQMKYIEQTNKILAISYTAVIIADPYSLNSEKTLLFQNLDYIDLMKGTNYALLSSQNCLLYVIDTINLIQVISFNTCQYGASVFDKVIYSNAYKLLNGLFLFTILDTGYRIQTWTFNTTSIQVQFNDYIPQPDNSIQYLNIDIHDRYDILFTIGSQYQIQTFQIQNNQDSQYTFQLLNSFVLSNDNNQDLKNIKYINYVLSSQQQNSLFLSDTSTIYKIDFQLSIDAVSQNIISINYLNQDNPIKFNPPGDQYTYWYYLEENQQIIVPLNSYYGNQAFTFTYNYVSNAQQKNQLYLNTAFTKQFQVNYNQETYFVTAQAQQLVVVKDSLSGPVVETAQLQNYVKQYPNSVIKVQNCPLCFVTLVQNAIVQFNKVLSDQQSCWSGLWYFYNLNLDQINQNIDAYHDGDSSIWVLIGLPFKYNNENYLFGILDPCNLQFQTLSSNNNDDNLNKSCYALYSHPNKLIIGLDVYGNVYAWNSQIISEFKFKKSITKYKCYNSGIGQLYNNNGQDIYLIAVCQDFQVISFNVMTEETQILDKINSRPNHINSFEDSQLLAVGDSNKGEVYLYKFNQQTGQFSLFMKFLNEKSKDQTINTIFYPDTQVLWIQYQYSNIYIPIGQCLNDVNNCLNCSMDFHFNTNELQLPDKTYGLGNNDSPFTSSMSMVQAFLKMQFYNQMFFGVQQIKANIFIDPSNSLIIFQELLQNSNANIININMISKDSQIQAKVKVLNLLKFSNLLNINLENILIIYQLSNNSPQQCGMQFENIIQQVTINNVNHQSSVPQIKCYSIVVNNSEVVLSNIIIQNQDFTNFSTMIQVINSSKITLNNVQINDCTLTNKFSVLSQLNDVQVIINKFLIQRNICNQDNNSQNLYIGQLFQASQYLVDDILTLSNIYSSDNKYIPVSSSDTDINFKISQLFQINKLQDIKISNITIKNHLEIGFLSVSQSKSVTLYNISYFNDPIYYQNIQSSSIYAVCISFNDINNLSLNIFTSNNIRAIDNSIIEISNQNYQNNIIDIKNVEIFDSVFEQKKVNSQANPIFILSEYYSNITISFSSFHNNILNGLFNSQTYSTTAIQIINSLGDLQLSDNTFSNSRSNSIYNYLYIQSNNVVITKSMFSQSSFDFSDNSSLFIQSGGCIRIKSNNFQIKKSQFKQSTSKYGSFLYVEPLSQQLSIKINDSSFAQGYSSNDGAAFYISSQNTQFKLEILNTNFTDIYTLSENSNAIQIYQNSPLIQRNILNEIVLNDLQIINQLGLKDSSFLNTANTKITVLRMRVTQEQVLQISNSLQNYIGQLSQNTIFQIQNSNINLQDSEYFSLQSLETQNLPLLMSSLQSQISIINSNIYSSVFSKSVLDINLGQLTIKNSKFYDLKQVSQKSRIIQQMSNLQSQYNSLIKLTSVNLIVSDKSIFNNINCSQNCYGSSLFLNQTTFQIQDSQFINSQASYGGAIFLLGLNQASNIIYNSVFVNNQATDNGGALVLQVNDDDVFQFNIQQTLFRENKALQGFGGAMYLISSSKQPQKQQIQLQECSILQNSAKVGGGLYNQVILPSIDQKSLIEHNLGTIYGDDTFSYPSYLELINQSSFKYDKSSKIVVLNEFKSGGQLPEFIFQLRDESRKPISQIDGQVIQAKIQISDNTSQKDKYYFRGNQLIDMNKMQNIFNFTQIDFIGVPGTSVQIEFVSDSIKNYNKQTHLYDSSYSYLVQVNFRKCQYGEYINTEQENQQSRILQNAFFKGYKNKTKAYWSQIFLQQQQSKVYIKIFTNYLQIISSAFAFNQSFDQQIFSLPQYLGAPVSTSVDYFDCLLKDHSLSIPLIYQKLIILVISPIVKHVNQLINLNELQRHQLLMSIRNSTIPSPVILHENHKHQMTIQTPDIQQAPHIIDAKEEINMICSSILSSRNLGFENDQQIDANQKQQTFQTKQSKNVSEIQFSNIENPQKIQIKQKSTFSVLNQLIQKIENDKNSQSSENPELQYSPDILNAKERINVISSNVSSSRSIAYEDNLQIDANQKLLTFKDKQSKDDCKIQPSELKNVQKIYIKQKSQSSLENQLVQNIENQKNHLQTEYHDMFLQPTLETKEQINILSTGSMAFENNQQIDSNKKLQILNNKQSKGDSEVQTSVRKNVQRFFLEQKIPFKQDNQLTKKQLEEDDFMFNTQTEQFQYM